MGRPRIVRLRRRLCGRAAASLVALALSAPAWAAPVSPEQAPAPPAMPQLAQDVASPSANVRRQALRGLRERGGPETLSLLARLVGDAEVDIREGAVAGVIGVYVQPPREAFDHERGRRVRGGAVPRPALAGAGRTVGRAGQGARGRRPSVRRDAAYALGIVLTPPVTDAVAFEIIVLPERPRAVGESRGGPGARSPAGAGRRSAAHRPGQRRGSRRQARVDACARRSPGGTGGRGADRPVHVLRARGGGPLRAQCARGHRSLVEHPAVRSADHVRVSGTPTGGVRRPGALGSRRCGGAAHRGGDGLRERRACARSRWPSRWHPRVARASTACSTRSPIATGRTRRWPTWWSWAGRTSAAVAARLSDPNPVVREQIAIALGFIGGPEAAAALKGASGESDPDVRHAIDVAQVRATRTAAVPAKGAR